MDLGSCVKTRQIWPCFLIIFGLLLGAGCNDAQSPETMYRNYLYRLQNVSGLEEATSQPMTPMPRFPQHRNLAMSTSDFRIGLFDYLKLGNCNLMHMVSERNSGLGRVQRSSTRLNYELNFYQTILHCGENIQYQNGEKDPQFFIKIAEIREYKSRVLPIIYWNATLASSEFRSFTSTHTRPLARNEKVDYADITAALDYLSAIGERLKSENDPPHSERIEHHLKTLQSTKTLGKLLQGLHLSHYYLGRATRLIERAAKQNKICPYGKKTRQGQFLWNIFMQFYIGEVQAYLNAIHEPSQQILTSVRRLQSSQTVVTPKAFQIFYSALLDLNRPDSLWHRYKKRLSAHTAAWQNLLKECQLLPQQPNPG